MTYIYLIGDSHLMKCQRHAEETGNSNFGYSNLRNVWASNICQLAHLEAKFKQDVALYGYPKAAFVMCGSYDLMTLNSSKSVTKRLQTFITHLNSTPVEYIVVCAVLDRNCPKSQEQCNRNVKLVNKALAKEFRHSSKVFFINVRPHGKIADITDKDHFHFKEEYYASIFKRLLFTFEGRILPKIPTASLIEPKEITMKTLGSKVEEEQIVMPSKVDSISERLTGFKDVLVRDYKRTCTKEEELAAKKRKIDEELLEVSKEKTEILCAYKRLFGADLSVNEASSKPQ